jgi:hypothetical protein
VDPQIVGTFALTVLYLLLGGGGTTDVFDITVITERAKDVEMQS